MKPIAVVALLLVAILGSSSAFIVRENELAVLFQFGAVQRTDFGPGLHFKLPLVQNVRKFDRRILTLDSEPERFLTSEKKDVFVDFFVKWRIADVSKFYTASSGDEQLAAQRLAPIVRQALGREINSRKLQEVISAERTNVMEELRESATKAVTELGIELVDVRIKRIDLPEEVSDSVFRRMRAERFKVANELRSQGQEQSETIRADADRQRQVLLAEAQRDGQTWRGEGDAKAAGIHARAYSRDAEFYAFWRSLQAYRESFRNKDGVIVLDPDSELFEYFGESGTRQ